MSLQNNDISFRHFCHLITRLWVKIQKKLEETEHVLLDLEERHRQANATIKEKEYLISNLLKSGRWHFLQIILQFWLLYFFLFLFG